MVDDNQPEANTEDEGASIPDPGSGSTTFGNDSFDSNFSPTDNVLLVELPTQTVSPGDGDLLIELNIPIGYKLNADAPQRIELSSSGAAITVPEAWADYREVNPETPYNIGLTLSAGEATLTGDMQIYWCEAVNESLCFIQDATVVIPVVVADDATSSEMIATIDLFPPVILD